MMYARAVAACAIGVVCVTHGLDAQPLSRYRDFELGSNLASVAAKAGVPASTVTTHRQRPSILQDLEWRPSRWVPGAATPSGDPVEQVRFSFYNDQLYRLVSDYNHTRTEGLTTADMIAALSPAYGTPVPKSLWQPGRAASPVEGDSGSPVARWEDAGHSVVLYRTSSYRPTFRLIVVDTRLHELARKAEAQAMRLEEQEAPSREIARQKKARDDERAASAKTRTTNKEAFRP